MKPTMPKITEASNSPPRSQFERGSNILPFGSSGCGCFYPFGI